MNRIDIVLGLVDQLTGPLNKVTRGAVKTASNAGDKIGGSISNLGGKGSPMGALGSALFGLGVTGIVAGVGAITGAVFGLNRALSEGMSLESMAIARSSDIGTNLGISIGSARAVYDQTQAQIAQLAAALPGTTKDYNEIFSNIAPSVSSVFRGDSQGFQEAAVDISSRAGVLASVNRIDPSMSGSAINRLISGTSGFQEMMVVDIFQKSGQLQQALRDGLANLGKSTEDWKDLTTQERLKITQEAFRVATPDSLLKEFEGTADSIIQGWKTSLFDPLTGSLGVLRKIEGRSALDAFTDLLASLDRLKDKLPNMGDPMAGVIRVLDWITGLVDSVDSMGGFSLGGLLGFTDRIVSGFNGILDNLLTALVNWDAATWASGFVDLVWNALGYLGYILAGIDWSTVAAVLLTAAYRVIEFLGVALIELNQRIYRALTDMMGQAVGWVGEYIGDAIKYLFDAVGKAIRNAIANIPIIGNLVAPVITGTPTPSQGIRSGRLPVPRPPGNNQTVTNNLQVSVGGTQATPDEIAEATFSRLSGRYTQAKQSRLAS
jgi:hypothetical protein